RRWATRGVEPANNFVNKTKTIPAKTKALIPVREQGLVRTAIIGFKPKNSNGLFQSRGRDPLDEVSLSDQEHDRDGDGNEQGGRHQEMVILAVKGNEVLQTQSQGLFAVGIQVDQGIQIIVPVIDEGKDRNGGQSGFAQGQKNAPKD